jgi:carotenoid cleavage dioxygenase
MHAMKTRRHRWHFDLRTGRTREQSVDDECSEFPMINSARAGQKHRYVYAAIGEPGFFLFRGLVKTDVTTGAKSSYLCPEGVYLSEAPFCPRDGATEEDDGYVVTFTIDVANDRSECLVFDARAIEKGPIARVKLPMRIASGTHATWTGLSSR